MRLLLALIFSFVHSSQLAPLEPPRAPLASPPTFTIGTFNIRYATASDGANAWEHRRAMVTSLLHDGDFWGLQEALPTQVTELKTACPEFDVVVRTRELDAASGEACPIFFRSSKWTIDPKEQGTFWLSLTPDIAGSKSWYSSLPRICTFARFSERRVADAAGVARSIYIFNVHFDHQGATARLESAKLIMQRIAARTHNDPVVLLGDFNTGPTSEPIALITNSTTPRLIDVWKALHPTEPEQGTFNGWAEKCGNSRIDFIFASAGLTPASCDIDLTKPNGRWPSDHAAVRATMKFR